MLWRFQFGCGLLSLWMLISCNEASVDLELGEGLSETIESVPQLQEQTTTLGRSAEQISQSTQRLDERLSLEELRLEALRILEDFKEARLQELRLGSTPASPLLGPDGRTGLFRNYRGMNQDGIDVFIWPQEGLSDESLWDPAVEEDSVLVFPQSGGGLQIIADQFHLKEDESLFTQGRDLVIAANRIVIDGLISTQPICDEEGLFFCSFGTFAEPPPSGNLILLASVVEWGANAEVDLSGESPRRFSEQSEEAEVDLSIIDWEALREKLMREQLVRVAGAWSAEFPPKTMEGPESRTIIEQIARSWTSRVRFELWQRAIGELLPSRTGSVNLRNVSNVRMLPSERSVEEDAFARLLNANQRSRDSHYETHSRGFLQLWRNLLKETWDEIDGTAAEAMAQRLRARGIHVRQNSVRGRETDKFVVTDGKMRVEVVVLKREHGLDLAPSRSSLRVAIPETLVLRGRTEGARAGHFEQVSVLENFSRGLDGRINQAQGEALLEREFSIGEAVEKWSRASQRRTFFVEGASNWRFRQGRLEVQTSVQEEAQIEFKLRGFSEKSEAFFVGPPRGEWWPVTIDYRSERRQEQRAPSSRVRPDRSSSSPEAQIRSGTAAALLAVAQSWGLASRDFPSSWTEVLLLEEYVESLRSGSRPWTREELDRLIQNYSRD